MNKIRINGKTYELNNYYSTFTANNRQAWCFDINASHDEIKPLALQCNELVIISEIEDKSSERDLTTECVLFDSLLDKVDNTCTLTMSNYSDVELLEKTIEELLEV